MQVIPRCRNLSIIQKCLSFPSSSSTHLSSFHSTSFCEDKRKNKWNFDFKRSQQPSKSHAKYAIRQRRADTKRALKTFLFRYGELRTNDEHTWNGTGNFKTDIGGHSNSSTNRGRGQSETQRAEKIRNHRMRRKFRKGHLADDEDDYHETIFEATFGDRRYTWSFNKGSSGCSNSGFDWRKTFRRASCSEEDWETSNEPDSGDEIYTVGSRTDRSILGLPLIGPLKMEDVKSAFHLSALKWHPDKHPGPMQAEAAEKFKICVNSYKSLCSELSRA